jgi:hypothetical protein
MRFIALLNKLSGADRANPPKGQPAGSCGNLSGRLTLPLDSEESAAVSLHISEDGT